MQLVEPEVYIVARPQIDGRAVLKYLESVEGINWHDRVFIDDPYMPIPSDAETLIEFMGRLCYRSWKPGLNPNVTRVREDSAAYLRNLLAVKHGSVLEHATFSFVFANVSRVVTHELVRHRAGWAFSQESLRFVRLTDLDMWLPDWMLQDRYFLQEARDLIERLEKFQAWMADYFEIEGGKFHRKKIITSAMRRFAPIGLATTIGASANIRAIRHVIEMRTAPGAEEEIRLVFGKVAGLMKEECPLLFGDYERLEDGTWQTPHNKV